MSIAAVNVELDQLRSKGLFLIPPIVAAPYPYILKAFNWSVTQPGGPSILPAAIALILAFLVPAIGLWVTMRLGESARPTAGETLARRVALVSIASPPIYVAAGVVLYMMGDPISDITFWFALTAVMLALSARAVAVANVPLAATPVEVSPRLRMAHGVSALAIVLLFLAMHLTNHFAGLFSEGAHRAVMAAFRHVYRAGLVEPVIVALFLFQIVTGLAMLRVYTLKPADFFRTFQIASGAFLVFFIAGHMNSVFFYARMFSGIQTDWNFATGAPTGLIKDAWNIRLLPHYAIGVFFVLSHLALGGRTVALAHGVAKSLADKLVVIGFALAAAVTAAIIVGMSGVHLQS